jgi:hypothetical protein
LNHARDYATIALRVWTEKDMSEDRIKLRSIDGEVEIYLDEFPRRINSKSLWSGSVYAFDETCEPHKRGPGYSLKISEPCWKCHGTGLLNHHMNVFNGQCFPCNGTGRSWRRAISVYPPEIAEKRAGKKAEKEAEKEAARELVAEAEAIMVAWANLPARELLNEIRSWGDISDAPAFVQSIVRKAGETSLSVRQIEVLESWIAEEHAKAEKAMRAIPVPEGREKVEGVVISTKWVRGSYGDTHKMLVEDDRGFRIFGTVPNAIWDVERGARVRFVATMERSRNDEKFGFFKRPAKAEAEEAEAA